MPGPAPIYGSAAERQRAYRSRRRREAEAGAAARAAILADHERSSGLLAALQDAVTAAQGHHAVAGQVRGESPTVTARNLVDFFHDWAETPPDKRPW